MSATASGVCHLPRGTTARILRSAHSSYDKRSADGVCSYQACQTALLSVVGTMPGHTEFTRTPGGARSLPRHCAKLMVAAFAALYGGSVCEPIWPATEAMKTIV